MTIPTLATPPATPQRLTDTPAEFVTNMDGWLYYEGGLSAELNAWATEVVAVVSGTDFNGSSTTSLTIGTGSKVFTTQAGKLWQIGQFVIAAYTTTPANYMYGQVTAYSGTSLTVNVTAVGGSGTQALWSIGLAPNATSYATQAGAETLTNKTIDLASNTVTGTTALFNTALSDGNFATLAGSEVLTGKTIALGSNTVSGTLAEFNTAVTDGDFASTSNPAWTGTPVQDVYAITDAAGFTIDPRNGSIQTITLGAARTPVVANFNNGDEILLQVAAAGFVITWTSVVGEWIDGTAPALNATGKTAIRLWKAGGTIYGCRMVSVPATQGKAKVGGITATGTTSGSTTNPSCALTALTGGISTTAIAGDVVVVGIGTANDFGTSLNLAMSTAGYTELCDVSSTDTPNFNCDLAVFYKVMTSTPDTTAVGEIPANTNGSYCMIVEVWRGIDPAVIDATTTTATGSDSVLANPPSITPLTSGTVLLAFGAGVHNAGAQTFTTGFANQVTLGVNGTTYDASLAMGWLANILAANDPAAFTFSTSDNANYCWAAATVLLRSAA